MPLSKRKMLRIQEDAVDDYFELINARKRIKYLSSEKDRLTRKVLKLEKEVEDLLCSKTRRDAIRKIERISDDLFRKMHTFQALVRAVSLLGLETNDPKQEEVSENAH